MKSQDIQLNYKISVNFDYRLIFSEGVFSKDNSTLDKILNEGSAQGGRPRSLVFLDEGLSLAHPGLRKKIEDYFFHYRESLTLTGSPLLIPGGEKSKQNISLFKWVIESIQNANICRHSYVIVVGGGSVIDLVCFAASIVHRGIRQIRIPSTVLAQDDAGIGIKNGIDAFNQKNFLGSFYPPFAVINDAQLLSTLSQENWISGIAEAVKVALIKDPEFFDWILKNLYPLKNRNLEAIRKLIQRCAELHLLHIRTSGDPFEMESARPLDFGHWTAHKLETLSDYTIPHGHAVATGMILDLFYSKRMGWTSAADVEKISNCLSQLGFTLWQPLLLKKNPKTLRYLILDGLNEFKEHLGGILNITLLKRVGEPFQVQQIEEDQIIAAIDEFRNETT